jgi:hypothetical protein
MMQNFSVADLYTPSGLVSSLLAVAQSDYVRVTATWLSRVVDWVSEPTLSGNAIVDALVAAACGYVAARRGAPLPTWIHSRALPGFWYQGIPGLFAWSFAHAPISFKMLGVIIEEESLGCV